MPNSRWIWIAAIVFIVGGLWYTGTLQNLMPAGSDESAAAANAIKATTVATAIQKTVQDISIAAGNKNTQAINALKPEFISTTNSIATLAPLLQASINAAMSKGKNMSKAQAAYTNLTTKLSYLQSSVLTLANAQIDITNLNSIYASISVIKTAIQTK